jgi:hypothetical protein
MIPRQPKQPTNQTMKRSNQLLIVTGVALACLLGNGAMAQSQTQTNRAEGQNLRNMDWQNMDPQEIQKMIQQRMMEAMRERLEVTDDAEWKIVEERLSKVTQARMATMADGGGMMGFGGMGGRGGPGGPPGGGRGFQNFFGQPSPESQALQRAVDSKASAVEIKAQLAKFLAARKEKQANLVKAQNELRQVLTPRQEAIAALMGLVE